MESFNGLRWQIGPEAHSLLTQGIRIETDDYYHPLIINSLPPS